MSLIEFVNIHSVSQQVLEPNAQKYKVTKKYASL